MNELIVFLVLFFSISTLYVVLKVTVIVIFKEPKVAVSAFLCATVGAFVGYVRDGVISAEITLYGIIGFGIYLLYVLIKTESIEL